MYLVVKKKHPKIFTFYIFLNSKASQRNFRESNFAFDSITKIYLNNIHQYDVPHLTQPGRLGCPILYQEFVLEVMGPKLA